ncbi:MAG: hypothetical protein NC816_01370 [Candidatus Omnitrophica bacterium]|nr:hypothetical protein [Candidatus Omnitrophota bacterium]
MKKGFSLILSLITFAIIEIIIVSIFGIVENEARMTIRKADSTILFYAAEAGIEQAKCYVKEIPGWLENGGTNPSIVNSQFGSATVTVTVSDNSDSDGFYTITSRATWQNSPLTRSISIKAKPPVRSSMSQFMFFIDAAHLNIGTGAEVWGKVHSNRNINIFGGGAIFHDEVTAHNKIIFYEGANRSNTIFEKGYQEDVPQIPMPEITSLNELRQYAIQDNFYFQRPISIELLPTGQVKINNSAPLSLPQNGVIFCERDIDIKGTLNGLLTVVSMGTINIIGNLIYLDPNLPPPDGGDLLGLIANNHIYIPQSAPYNLEINAALFARQGKAYCFLGDRRGTLIIKGSLATSQLSYFSSTSGHGYSIRKYYFDERFRTYAPPHFVHFETYYFKDWKDMGEQ